MSNDLLFSKVEGRTMADHLPSGDTNTPFSITDFSFDNLLYIAIFPDKGSAISPKTTASPSSIRVFTGKSASVFLSLNFG